MQNVCVGEKHARFFQYNNSDLLHEVNKVIDANENNLVIYIKNVMKKNLINSQPASYIGDIQAKTEWRGYKGGPWRFRSCAGRHGNRGIWTYSGRGPQKECPAYGKCFL